MINHKYFLIFLSCSISLLTCCNKDDEAERLKEEERRLLQQYLEINKITQEPTESGLYYIILDTANGQLPKLDSWVDIQYTGRLIGGLVFETNLEQVARENDLYDPAVVYGMTRLYVDDIDMEGLKEGIQYMNVGETARLIIPSHLALGGDSRGRIEPYSTLIFDITLMDEFDDPVQHQNDELDLYFADTVSLADTTEEGIYYFDNTIGYGDTLGFTEDVYVYYTGSFLDGRVFESNFGTEEPLLIYYPDQSDVIPGFMAALSYMREGGVATVIIPYQHAYGSQGAKTPLGYTIVPPYMPLKFKIKLYWID